ncbi:hypothetical protein KL939_004220 [Ogataea angusta]|nr:hypothetical protein KL939_004220 [Ogataea angusta]
MMTERLGTSGSMGWAWVYGINSWYSSLVAGISNQSDYSRFNKKEWHSHLGILVGCNVAGFIVPLFGIVTASALAEKYGQEFWMPNDICMFCSASTVSATPSVAAWTLRQFFHATSTSEGARFCVFCCPGPRSRGSSSTRPPRF